MVAVEQPQERALGHAPAACRAAAAAGSAADRARDRTRASSNRGPGDHVREELAAPASANRSSVVSAEERGVGADFGVELRADAARAPRAARAHRDRRSPRRAGRRSCAARPGRSAGSNAAPAGISDEHADERHLTVLDRPDVEAVRRAAPPDLGKDEGRLGAEVGQRGPIDGHQDTATGWSRRSARPGRPRGTTLSTTRSGPEPARRPRLRRSSGVAWVYRARSRSK